MGHYVNGRLTCAEKTGPKPWPQLTCTENFVKFGCVLFEIRKWTDIQCLSTWIHLMHIGTTYEEYLVVLQNLVCIDALVLIIWF